MAKKRVAASKLLDALLKNAPEADHNAIIRLLGEIAASKGQPITALLCIMHFESGLNPARVNSIGATGLIQFVPNTAKWLGTSTTALRQMSVLQQLFYVKKYFDNYNVRCENIAQFYLLVLYGGFVTKSNEYKLKDFYGSYDKPVRRQAKCLYGADGYITLDSVFNFFKTTYI